MYNICNVIDVFIIITNINIHLIIVVVNSFLKKGGENMANLEIRQAIENAGIKYWQVADKYGITDGNFSKMLRKELTVEKKNKILNIINQISKED